MFRRSVLSVALLAVLSTVTTTAGAAVSAEPHGGDPTGRFDRPQQGFASPRTVLRDGSPRSVGLDPAPIDEALGRIDGWTRTHPTPNTDHPLYSGAVTLLAHDGVVVSRETAGYAVRYADGAGTELPDADKVPMRTDTIFDMASVSKLFTSILVMQLAERGEIDVDAPAATYLPEFGVNGKESITVGQLLTHTSGLVSWLPLWSAYPDPPSRIKAVMDVAPRTTPGTNYEYSDLNLITLGVLVERLTGKTLDKVVAERITGPLRMVDTGYNPPAEKLDRIAATEFQTTPPRGMVRGSVHDENAWSLGGVAGHAGVFSTANDMAILAQTILNGGTYRGHRIMRPDTVQAMIDNHNEAFPGDDHGYGFELNQIWYMGGLSGAHTAGHTGYTGTDVVIDPASRSFAILLTNRVHPSRSWGSINLAREVLCTGLAKSLAVRPKRGRDAWYTGIGDASQATLTTLPLRPTGPVRVNFDAFVDSESTDLLVLESSTDGTTWTAVPLSVSGRGAPDETVTSLSGSGHRDWWKVRAQLPHAAEITLRWRFTTDARYTGRGISLDGLAITDSVQTLLNGEKEPHKVQADGWQLRSR
ncbi:MAG: serine hydrolase [Actinophytocola sp.]|uniref:serine hydrolase domain-containing protein n=1 Tax=Actinophytocola sp. TaxID=1872138 RepID=UPI001327102D|nr:serine hydrolase domain-containing protein [Actinophytocola sp.]MPZ82049.1 serine hydrolase [Actinophytocola sp.]